MAIRRRIGAANSGRRVPPLEFGDQLTREEFERRYRSAPQPGKAELIEGVVYLRPHPDSEDYVRARDHLGAWLRLYHRDTEGVEVAGGRFVRLDWENEPQPEACLRIEASHGGQSRLSDDGCIEGAPEWIAEIAPSSAGCELHDKFHVYRRAGVREYVVWELLEEEILWFRLHEGRYLPVDPDDSGVYKSEVFPGLWLDARRLVAGDMGAVLNASRQGVATLEHAVFVSQLQAARRRR